ncbi:glycoside hydrolase family 43 protein [Glycomyces harbinensis]|uniref:Alpha-L-arabinofuranosidase B (ABFB) domain-containing protein n=1 Tax=Glycomyces harbinensis TaxID=58114 RepID=A0A1G7BVN9_9ACTN|nr:glycoside hydrolase family 43 protein [Glycomyces harbinensis]SDE31168.1 Alpha-L-arabinofuranosidase B (ABFB) domain-containing protein [Glycomyces harbinensis]
MLSRRRLLTTAAAAAAAPLAFAVPASAQSNAAYAMAYFKESPNLTDDSYALHLAVSANGLQWTPLNQNQPVATPTAGMQGLRDPFLLRKRNGAFAVLATDLKGRVFNLDNQYIHVWDSADLRSFTGYRRVKLHDTATHSWAPTAFWDPSRSRYAVVYSAYNGTRDVLLVNYTADFVNMGAAQVFFDPGFNVLDGDVLVHDGAFYLAYKNMADGNLYVSRSTTGQPNTFTTLTSGLRQGSAIEAPILVKSYAGNTFWLWGDSFSPDNAVFYAWQSSNIAGNSWSALDQRGYTAPISSKHASIVPITEAERAALVTRWGAPQWNRLKSYNYPGRFVRHAGNVGRIDPFPMEPPADQQWRLRPGLADAAGVSFESVNYPGRYLRHVNYAVNLVANDGTAQFAQDATFHRTAGLADGAWASFTSHNHPTRYLRHSGFVLRIDPVSTAADRADATFQLTY